MLRQEVTVEPFTGEGAHGAVYGPPVVEKARVQEGGDYDEGQAERQQTTSTTTVYLRFEAACPERSRVTLPSGTVGTVVAVSRHAEPRRLRHLRVSVR